MIFFLIILPFLLFPKSSFAAPTVTINQPIEPIIIGNPTTISFTVTNNDIGNTYHYKVVGVGISLDNLPDAQCNNFYDNCPIFSIGTSETINQSSSIKVTGGSGQIKIKFVQADDHNKPSNKESDPVSVDLRIPTPTVTSTPTNTPSPTNTPNPTSTPNPTAVPTTTNTPIPTSTLTPTPANSPTPTKKPTAIPTVKTIPTPTEDWGSYSHEDDSSSLVSEEQLSPNTDTDSILGTSDIITPTSTPIPVSSKQGQSVSNILPILFISIGGILLLTPLIITKLNREKKVN